MVKLTPFRAIRPRDARASALAALPYDVYDREEARAYVEAHPDSFLAIDRPETQFPPSHDMYADDVYQKAHELLRAQIAAGDYAQDPAPSYYLYEQTFRGRTQTGVVGCASVDDYLDGTIRKHENTRPEKERDRIRHIDAVGAQTGPIFLCYKRQAALRALLEELKGRLAPRCDFVSEGPVRNRVFVVSDEADIARITAAFAAMDAVYIADGHHRCASAVRVALKRRETAPAGETAPESDVFLSVLFSEDELQIMDYNRVVRDLNGMTPDAFLDRLAEKFTLQRLSPDGEGNTPDPETLKPAEKGRLALYLDGAWYGLTAKPALQRDDPVEGLDVSILQNEVLAPLLGIEDPKTDPRVDFVGGIRGMKELERRCRTDMRLAFALYPTSMRELFAVADEGRLMPPKSTWFEPKLLSGLFIHAF